MIFAIVPARGGSQRIKNKNIKKFYSKPILYWTLKTLKKSKLFSRIVLTTDSNKIKTIAKKLLVAVKLVKLNVYKLNYSFEATDILKSDFINKPVTKYFEEGELLIGDNYKSGYIIVDDRFVFPTDYVEKTDTMPYLKKDSSFDETIDRIKQQSIILSEKQEQEGKKAKDIKKEASYYKRGAILGLACGIISALYLKKSIWVFSILGVAIGGYVSHKIYTAKKGNNDVQTI